MGFRRRLRTLDSARRPGLGRRDPGLHRACRSRSRPGPVPPALRCRRSGAAKPEALDPRKPPPKRPPSRELVEVPCRKLATPAFRSRRCRSTPRVRPPRPRSAEANRDQRRTRSSVRRRSGVPRFRASARRWTSKRPSPGRAARTELDVWSKPDAGLPSPPETYANAPFLRWEWAIGWRAEARSDPARESRPFAAAGPEVSRAERGSARAPQPELHRASGGARWSAPPKRLGSASAQRRPGRASSPPGVSSPRESAARAPVV